MNATAYDAARGHVQAIRSLLEASTEICNDTKCEWRRIVDDAENRCVAFSFAKELAAGLPADAQRRLAIAVGSGSSSQLADFRERINRGLPTTAVERLLGTAENPQK